MSVRALSWSFALPLQDMAAKAVLHALADHADEDGKCWPSLKRIALFAGCSENTARRALESAIGEELSYYAVGDWRFGNNNAKGGAAENGITRKPTDEELEAITRKIEADADVLLIGSVLSELEYIRDHLPNEDQD